MTFDVAAFREHFPSLRSGIAHFDGPGGTQTPAVVGEAIAATLTGPLSNRGVGLQSEQNADDRVRDFRAAYADLMGATPAGVIYGRSATALTYDFSRSLSRDWGPGDEVVVSELDHDANVRPWVQAAERTGATVRWLRLDPTTAELRLDELDGVVGDRTKVVALAAASNLLGTTPPIAQIASRAHQVGALMYVDAVHYAAHGTVDLAAWDADFVVCSPYKLFGPHCGVLAADPALLETIRPDKLLPSTDDVPERFELGTLPYEIMAGATAAADFLAGLAPEGGSRREQIIAAHAIIHEHETRLRRRVEEALSGYGDRVRLHSVASERTPTLFLTLPGRDSGAASRFLAERHVLVPSGSFYAHEPFRALGLDVDAGLRIGVAAYTDDSDIDRLIAGLDDFLA